MTELDEILLSSGSKNMINQALLYIGNDKERVEELLKLFDNKTDKLAMRASWVASWLYEKYPLLENYGAFLLHTLKTTPQESIRRNIARVFAFSSLQEGTENLLVPLIDTPK